jgi:long-chain acyl-CoA synthetase
VWPQALALDAGDPDSLHLPAVHKLALERIAAQTRDFARYATPRAVYLTQEPWTPENTLMTPTLKLKRNNLMVRYARRNRRHVPAGACGPRHPHKPCMAGVCEN